MEQKDLFTGLLKALCFGGVVGTVSCYFGMNVSGGAEGWAAPHRFRGHLSNRDAGNGCPSHRHNLLLMSKKSEFALEARDLHRSFGKQKVMDGITFKIRHGEILVIMGGAAVERAPFCVT